MPDSPMLTSEALEAIERVWHDDDGNHPATGRAFLAAQDREALAERIVAHPKCAALDIDGATAYTVIDALLGEA